MSHVGLAPLQVVGYEGLLGTLVLFLFLMPIVYFIPGKDGQGLHEDSLETAYMVSGLPSVWLRRCCMPAFACGDCLMLCLHPASCVLRWPCSRQEGRQARKQANVQSRRSSEQMREVRKQRTDKRFLAVQIGHSEPRWSIPLVLIANSLSLLLYNVAGMFVTEEMGAVSRTVFESARTLFVWLGDLLLYYTHTGLGEKWDNSSYLQVCLT